MPVKKIYKSVAEVFGHDIAPGLTLIAAAVLALVVMNSGMADSYTQALATKFTISYGDIGLSKALLLWINDFLMAIFFLHVGLEIKREVVDGELSSLRSASLPAVAAIGGMVAPALIYFGINYGDSSALEGWAIPAATDIAFALGVLALLGKRVPVALKVLLLAVAIIDDLGAIVIIALFYTANLSGIALGVAALVIAGLVTLNRLGVRSITPYMLLGLVLWVAVLKSGVHATLAGVVVAFCIPITGATKDEEGPLLTLEHALTPWVAFGIMPVFAFANAGVSLAGMTPAALMEPIAMGIALGLFFGKQIGIMGGCLLAVKLGIASLPSGIKWKHMWGLSMLAGIGFTMSLFIGNLAFDSVEQAASVRIGVLSGSILAAIAGYMMLRVVGRSSD
ncbi:MAG: Na+/H+ antiporter NhaA [Alphaproteobacteria bacterium]|nr:Na+/H+ antiporter NhaA [Alphaproteobacteria bacterium]